MSTTPTNLPVPSEKPQDLKFNAGKIDEFVTSMAQQYIDRFGGKHYTIEGLRWVAQQAISAFGYITLKSFQIGAPLPDNELTLPNQVLQDETDGEYYRWDGEFPKVVPPGSTPSSTGGIGEGAWVGVGDASLRSDLASPSGGGLVSLSQGGTVQDAVTWVTPQMFGALADGIADDSVAFTKAYATGHQVFIPVGKYKVGGVIIPYKSTTRCEDTANTILMPMVGAEFMFNFVGDDRDSDSELTLWSGGYFTDPAGTASSTAIAFKNKIPSVTIENARFDSFFRAFDNTTSEGATFFFRRCFFWRCRYGIYNTLGGILSKISESVFTQCECAIWVDNSTAPTYQAEGIGIHNCDITHSGVLGLMPGVAAVNLRSAQYSEITGHTTIDRNFTHGVFIRDCKWLYIDPAVYIATRNDNPTPTHGIYLIGNNQHSTIGGIIEFTTGYGIYDLGTATSFYKNITSRSNALGDIFVSGHTVLATNCLLNSATSAQITSNGSLQWTGGAASVPPVQVTPSSLIVENVYGIDDVPIRDILARVKANGTTDYVSACTATRSAVGSYSIAFKTVSPIVPFVDIQLVTQIPTYVVKIGTINTTGCVFVVYDTQTGANVDCDFVFKGRLPRTPKVV